jgi:hypothetical protein
MQIKQIGGSFFFLVEFQTLRFIAPKLTAIVSQILRGNIKKIEEIKKIERKSTGYSALKLREILHGVCGSTFLFGVAYLVCRKEVKA